MLHQSAAALDACIADAADLFTVEALPLAVVEAVHERDDVHRLQWENEAKRALSTSVLHIVSTSALHIVSTN